MYKKKNRTPALAAGAAVVVLVVLLVLLRTMQGQSGRQRTEEPVTHEALIYKTSGGSIEFDKAWLSEETDREVKLQIEENTMVSLVVHVTEGKVFSEASINEAHNIENTVSFLVNDAEEDSKRINFVMPKEDVIINLSFTDAETDDMDMQPALQEDTEAMSEKEDENTSPYGLKLHGLTVEIISSYNGAFDDRKFLQQLGDQLRIDDPASEYRSVTDVTFATEEYKGEKEEGKVYHYIYLNNDPTWRLLASYFSAEDAYVFTIADEEENQTESKAAENTQAVSYPSAGRGGGASSPARTTEQTVTTSFDIMHVSKTFLKFCGGEEPFYEETFQYVLLKKLTGNIIGTMNSYRIYPEENKAEFTISLNTGGRINGSYNRNTAKFSFKGL